MFTLNNQPSKRTSIIRFHKILMHHIFWTLIVLLTVWLKCVLCIQIDDDSSNGVAIKDDPVGRETNRLRIEMLIGSKWIRLIGNRNIWWDWKKMSDKHWSLQHFNFSSIVLCRQKCFCVSIEIFSNVGKVCCTLQTTHFICLY